MNDDPNAIANNSSSAVVMPTPEPARRRRGFACMDREQVREIARRGGVAAHKAGTAHEFTTEEAKAAGSKGGHAAHAAEARRTGEKST